MRLRVSPCSAFWDDSENKTTTTTTTSRHCGAGAFLHSAWPRKKSRDKTKDFGPRGKKKGRTADGVWRADRDEQGREGHERT